MAPRGRPPAPATHVCGRRAAAPSLTQAMLRHLHTLSVVWCFVVLSSLGMHYMYMYTVQCIRLDL